MKKLVLFLSIIMFAFTGFVFACNNDRYADLSISATVFSETSGGLIEEVDGCYQVILGETIKIDGKLHTSNGDISKTLIFESESGESLNHIRGLDTDTADGTQATFKASAPSFDNNFKIKIASNEATHKYKEIFVRVVLPLERIELKNNLCLTNRSDINLNDQVVYTKAIQSQYETNEKGANFVLKSFTSNKENAVKEFLIEDGYGNYYFETDSNKKTVFTLNNGVVSVKDKNLEGSLFVEARSSVKFDKSLEELEIKAGKGEIELTEDQQVLIDNNNDKFKADTTISVVKGLSAQDFSFEGGQIGFVSSAQEGQLKSKLDASLYINSLDTYKINEQTYSYNYEKIDFNLTTDQDISFDVVMVEGSTKDVVSTANLEDIILNKTGTSGYNATLQFNAGGSNGNAYFDFVVNYIGFDNLISYKFSELYSEFLSSLTEEQKQNYDTTNNYLTFNASALPSNIAAYQDGNKVETGNSSMIKIFDVYEKGTNISTYGTKIGAQLTLSSGLTSFNISDVNKKVRVYFKHSSMAVNINNYIEVRGANFNRITLNPIQRIVKDANGNIDTVNCYYLDLDLTNENTSYFYVKANNANFTQNAVFNIEFENILNSSIKTFKGVEIGPNIQMASGVSTSLKNLTAIVNAKTVKGVQNVMGVIKNAEDFYTIDTKHLNTEALYQKMVLKLHSSQTATEKSGSVLGVVVNEYVDEILAISAYDNEVVKIYELNSGDLFGSYISKYNEENADNKIQFNKAYSIVGLKLGSTTLKLVSENGYTTFVEVEVVNAISDIERNFAVEAKQGYSKVIYQDELNEESKYLSAKINGKFHLAWNTNPDKTGVVDVRYNIYKPGTTEKSNVLVIDSSTGLVDTREVGKADVEIAVTYYVFDNTSGYYQWSSQEHKLNFVFEVFEPATMFRLTNNGISNVYSYDSLGYEFKSQSIVNIGVIISPANATINSNKDEVVSYTVDSNSRNLRGSNGVYTAYLKDGQTRATEFVTVRIEEFGVVTYLKYTVNIFKAPQIEAIESAVFEGENEKSQKLFAVDSQGSEVEYISTTNNKTLTFNTTISPSSVYNDDLIVKIFKAQDNNSHGFTTNEFDSDYYATLKYSGAKDGQLSVGQTVELNNGRDSFDVEISADKTGFFYVVIFARDSMTSKNSGLVYKKYAVEITDGSLESPYVIESAKQLMEIANNPSKHYVLGANINLSFMSNWTPIKDFSGSLNGFNANIKQDENSIGTFYKISGLKISSLGSGFVGLFEKILVNPLTESVGAVMNLALEVESINLTNKFVDNSFIDTAVCIGAIAGVNDGLISNCSVNFEDISVLIKNKNANIGGMVGANNGAIFNFPNEIGLSSRSYGSLASDFKVISKTFVDAYSEKDYLLNVSQIDQTFVSANPVNGNLYVSDSTFDSTSYFVNAGGMVGANYGVINGLYGVYNLIEEKNLVEAVVANNVNYLTSYQSQGVDVKVNINHKDSGYSVENSTSAVGGVAGYNENAKIFNTSVEAVIGYNIGSEVFGVKDCVGGVVGKAGNAGADMPEYGEENIFYNLMVSAKIRAKDCVGGVVGSGLYATIEKVRVENYEDASSNEDYSQTMILANNYIGGVAGQLIESTVFTAYSNSYVDLLNPSYIKNPDIVSFSNAESNVGGIVGSLSGTTKISAAYSTFGLKSTSAAANVAGIVGSYSSRFSDLLINNVYYIGVLSTPKEITVSNSLANNTETAEQEISGYYFYYVLDYVDSTDIENGEDYDTVVCELSREGEEVLEVQDKFDTTKKNKDFYSSDNVYSLTVSVVEGGVVSDETFEIQTRVLTYIGFEGNKFNFVRNIPDSIIVRANGDFANEIEDFELSLKVQAGASQYFYYYVDVDGFTHLVIRYNALNNIFSLNDIFRVTPNPNIAGKINILVSVEQGDVVAMTDDGYLVVNKIGSSLLKFEIRENVSNPTYVYVDVVKNFDEVLLSNSTNFKTSILNTQDSAINVRKMTDINIYSLLGEYVGAENIKGKFVYKTVEQGATTLYFVQIDGSSFYKLTFDIKYNNNGIFEYVADSYIIDGNTIKFVNDGVYRVVVSVEFTLLDKEGNSQKYYFTNFVDDDNDENEWISYFNVYSGATAIKFDTQSFGLTGNSVKTDLKLTLVTDEVFAADETLKEAFERIKVYVVTDNNTRYNLIATTREVHGAEITEYKFSAVDGDNILDMNLTSISHQGQTHTYTFNVGINQNYRYLSEIRTFKLYAYDVYENGAESVFINTPANVTVTLNPKGVSGVTTIHYAYTQKASQLENNANTDEIFGNNENANFSYSFSNEPKNSVIAGNEGLFVVDITPFYSNITSISIESSLSSESGNTLQFVQLVKIAGSDNNNYYIYAPQTKATESGKGIYLNKYSYIPSDIATLQVKNGTYQVVKALNQQIKYGFGEVDYTNFAGVTEDYGEVGRLYIKTVAPTNLKVEESFEVYVKVKYNALDSNGSLRTFEEVYTHKLFVESIPGASISINHDGNERRIIAYTGETVTAGRGIDYLDIMPVVDEGYTFESIAGELVQTSDASVKEKYDNGETYTTYANDDYRILTDLPNNAGKRLHLGVNAKVGDTIVITVTVSVNYEGYVESRQFKEIIRVVDVVIEDITIKDLDAEDKLKITVSTSKQLKVIIDGYGTKDAIEDAENAISRSISFETNSINYWFAKSQRTGEYFVNLDSTNIRNDLPFNVQKVAITNDENEIEVSSNSIGAISDAATTTVTTLPKLVVLEGSTSSGSVDMQIKFSYVYLDSEYRNGDVINKAGQIVFVPNTFKTTFSQQKFFTVEVTDDSNEDNPTPIYTAEKFYEYLSSTTGGDFILMEDITLSQHTAINAKFGSLDGNNKIITIDSFAYNPNLVSSSNTNYSINMGLFDTVSPSTIIKNVIVALPNNKKEPMNLKGYSTVNFGGIAAVNQGMITNCDVITITSQENSTLLNYREYDYSVNIETATLINGNEVSVNIGLLVGINESTGFVTNSRVGREEVDILTVYDSEATVVYKNKYAYTAPITLVKVYGRANVGGLVANNNGTISSSYVKNIQLEVNSVSSKDFVKTAGFVVTNKGYIYGSYVAGWEEEILTGSTQNNRKLGGGLYSNGFIGGFVYRNEKYIEDCYSNVNLSGDLTFAAQTSYIKFLMLGASATNPVKWISPAVGGFVYTSTEGSLINTSYSLSKIATSQDVGRSNTHGAFEGRMESADSNFVNAGKVSNSYFMLEKSETFSYEHEQAVKLTDEPSIDLEGDEEANGANEFTTPGSFNSFSFDNKIDNFKTYEGTSTGGVWAIYDIVDGQYGYPELISANTIAISSRVINVTKTNNSETNKFYYTYVDGYDIGSVNNPYIVSNFDQYNNIFKDAIGQESFNDNVTTKFTGNIRLISNINFNNSEEVYSTSIEYTSLVNATSIFDGNYLAMYNITLADKSSGRDSFGLFKDIYYAGVKNLTLAIDRVSAGNTTSVGALAGVIANSNISNVTLVASNAENGVVTGNHYVGALAGIIVSNDKENSFTVSNVKSNLSIVGSVSTSNEVNAITTSSVIWERIKPTATSSGLSTLNANLRLHKLPTNVYYAGGIAGIIDLHQVVEIEDNFELNTVNAYNIHVGTFDANTILESAVVNYDKKVSVISDYSGGLFGLIGSQTYLEASEFVAQQGGEDHYISAREIAGGIAAVNFGKISQSYLSYSKQQVIDLDTSTINYVSINAQENLHINSTLFAFGTPKYIGGIAGINIGNGEFGSGNIVDCYSRVDVKNASAIGVGGIVGGAYIGQISNVYTTSSLIGDLSRPSVTKIGAIIGKIFENGDEGYFADYHGSVDNDSDNNLALSNIVAVNLWDTNDFATLYNYAKNGGKIGALYGEFENEKIDEDSEESRFIKITQGVFVQSYILKDFTDADISSENFNIELLDADTYIEMWGVSYRRSATDETYLNSPNYNEFLNQHLCGNDLANLIKPNDYRALFSSANSTLRDTYFPATRWSRVIWNYDRYWNNDSSKVKLLPVLEYGYESSVIRIYTANQFFEKLNSGSSSGKLFVIMNDIDFDGITINPITLTFRGQLFGNNVTYKDEHGVEFTRKPILFNLSFNADGSNAETSISSIFQNTIGATFSNFNIVLSEYEVTFNQNIDAETIASVLVANSINTTVNNIHIYSSLTDKVNKEISEGYTFVSNDIKKQAVSVSQGYALESKQIVRYSNYSYLKLATIDSNDETPVEEFSAKECYYKNDPSGGNANTFKLVKYVDSNQNINYGAAEIANDANLKDRVIENSFAQVRTNASIVGMFMGVGSLSYVTSSSVNIPIFVSYSFAPKSSVYVGSMIGRNIGEMHDVVSTSNISLSVSGGIELNSVYVGGLVGNDQGVVRNAYIKNITINIGDHSNYINTSSGNSGTYIGGMIGSIDRYTTINEAVVGGANFLYINDCEINAYVHGTSKIAGVVGQNGFTISDVYYKQTYTVGHGGEKQQKAIKVNLANKNSESMVGGIVAENNSTNISGIYTNSSIIVNASEYGSVKLGGVIAYSQNEIVLSNVVNDAEKLEFNNLSNSANLGSLVMGGLVAEIANSSLSLFDVFSTVDIISTQEDTMNIGGMVGSIESTLYVSNGIQLGDIYLKRSFGTNDFFKNPHNIGGLIGLSEKTPEQKEDAIGFIVLSTIRDYALSQKTNVQIGPVFGTNGRNIKSELNIFFNENISLVSDNGYNTMIHNLAQSSGKENNDIYDAVKEIYNILILKVDTQTTNLYSHYFEKYFNLDKDNIANSDFFVGSKILPKEFTKSTTLEDNKYYVLNNNIDITSSISTSATNWLLNAQGYTIKGAYPVFSTITENSAVVGLMQNQNITSLSNSGVISKDNYGFIFSCGVSGNVSGSGAGIASIAYNNYGVVSTSFSIANITTKSTSTAGAGLVINNGATISGKTYFGNIYCSYFTGTLYPYDNSAASFAGIAVNTYPKGASTANGFISNCYTMGDIDISSDKMANVKPYPIATENTNRLYKTFYDYVAYTGTSDGQDITEAKTNNYITSKGIYVWSASLTGGSEKDKNYDSEVANVLGGNWLKPGIVDQLKSLFESSYAYNAEEEVQIDTSWFNYGYTTNNFINIIVGGQQDDDNIIKYLTMLYTGNGLASKEMASDDSLKHYTNAFLDYPYMVKHAGILDVLVSSNNIETGIEFKYYLLTKTIDFIKYTGKTYWSQAWDDNRVVFAGDLDGNGKAVQNMYSTYGLLRALPNVYTPHEIQSGIDTTVRNLTIKNSYSKTGLIAGYGATGVIKNVVFETSLVYNGNFDSLGTGDNAKYLGKEVYFNNVSTKNFAQKTFAGLEINVGNQKTTILKSSKNGNANFAGGVLGYMSGGIVDASCSFKNIYVLASNLIDSNNYTDVYVGGIAGVFVNGNIGGYKSTDVRERQTHSTNDIWDVKNLTVASVNAQISGETETNSFVGGIAGYVGTLNDGKAIISKVQTSSVTVRGSYSVGGIVGVVDGGEINNSNNNTANSIVAVNSKIDSSGTLGFSVVSTTVKETVPEVYFGGVAGTVLKGKINGSHASRDINIAVDLNVTGENNFVALGGIAGVVKSSNSNLLGCIAGGSDKNNIAVAITSSVALDVITAGVAGIVDGGAEIDNCRNYAKVGLATTSTISGGIAGKVIRGTIKNCKDTSNSVKSTISSKGIAGGVVGVIKAEEENAVEVSTNSFYGAVYGSQISGGIVGYIESNEDTENKVVTIYNCSTSAGGGNVGDSSTKIAGGIVGYSYNTKGKIENIQIVKNTSAISVVTANSTNKDNIAGGIVAVAKHTTLAGNNNTGSVTNAYIAGGIIAVAESCKITDKDIVGNYVANTVNTGAQVNAHAVAGGIVAIADGSTMLIGNIQNGSSTSNIVNSTGGGIAGGIIALVINANIDLGASIYNKSSIGSDKTWVAGGLIGYNKSNFNSNTCNVLTSSYSGDTNTGNITATSETILEGKNFVKYTLKSGIIEFKENTNYGLEITTSSIAGGLVGYTKDAINISKVKNNGQVYGKFYAGGILGFLSTGSAIISNVENKNIVDATNYAGGIVSVSTINITLITNNIKIVEGEPEKMIAIDESMFVFGSIKNSGDITAQTAGGVVGENKGSDIGINGGGIENSGTITCRNTSTSTDTPIIGAGGIVGYLSNGSVANSKNTGNVSAPNADGNKCSAGSLVGVLATGSIGEGNSIKGSVQGYNAGGVVGLYTSGDITSTEWGSVVTFGTSTNVGGVIGYMSANKELSAGTVGYDVTNGTNVGGLVGYMTNGTIKEGTVNSSSITGSTNVGGLVGYITSGTVKGGTAGTVKGGTNAGGLVGVLASSSAKVEGGTGKRVDSSATNAGGLVGLVENGQVSGGSSAGAKGSTNVGGLVGKMTGSDAKISGGGASGNAISSGTNAGGLVGLIENGTISSGSGLAVSGRENGGGIAGNMTGGKISGGSGGSVSSCTHGGGIVGMLTGGTVSGGRGGSVTGENGSNAGGVVGSMGGSAIVSGGSGGTVSGSPTNGGGIAGSISSGSITNGKSGKVESGTNVGGIAGKASGGTIANTPKADVKGTNAGGAVGSVTGNVTISAKIEEDITITGSTAAGGLVGVASDSSTQIYIGSTIEILGTIQNDDSGSITNVAALIPVNDVTIGSSSEKEIKLGDTARGFGLTITNNGTIANLKVSGTITSTTKVSLGGIAHTNSSTGVINKCKNNAKITLTGTNAKQVGGIAGLNQGNIYNCTNSGEISSALDSATAKTNSSGQDLFSKGLTNSGGIYTGGIAGYASSGRVEGDTIDKNKITANVSYSSTDTMAEIYDYRGQVVGNKEASATVVNTTKHTEYESSHELVPTGESYYWAAINKADGASWGDENSIKQSQSVTFIQVSQTTYNNLNSKDQGDIDNYIGSLKDINGNSPVWEKVQTVVTKYSGFNDSYYDAKQITTDGFNAWGLNENGLTWYGRSLGKTKGAWSQTKYRHDSEKLVGNSTSIEYWMILTIVEVAMENKYEFDSKDNDLQDCGGYVTASDGENKSNHEVNALKLLYDLCGPCGNNTKTEGITSGVLSGSDVSAGSGEGGTGSGGTGGSVDLPDFAEGITNFQLVDWVEFAYDDGGANRWGYCWGSYGRAIMNEAWRDRCYERIDATGSGENSKRMVDRSLELWYGRRVADCSGMILGFMQEYTSVNSNSYGYTVGAQYNAAKYKGSFGSAGSSVTVNGQTFEIGAYGLPEIPGIRVTNSGMGHTGVYIGNGMVIHAANTERGVIMTPIDERGWNWAYWSLPPAIDICLVEGTVWISASNNAMQG